MATWSQLWDLCSEKTRWPVVVQQRCDALTYYRSSCICLKESPGQGAAAGGDQGTGLPPIPPVWGPLQGGQVSQDPDWGQLGLTFIPVLGGGVDRGGGVVSSHGAGGHDKVGLVSFTSPLLALSHICNGDMLLSWRLQGVQG